MVFGLESWYQNPIPFPGEAQNKAYIIGISSVPQSQHNLLQTHLLPA